MSADHESSVRYRFGPLERRGLIAGWRGGQIAAVAAGLLFAMIAIRSDASIGGAVVALAMVGIAVAAATWPVKGRTFEEWAPDAVRYATRPGNRKSTSRADPFTFLTLVPVQVGDAKGSTHGRDAHGGQAGVIVDRAGRTYTASFFARSPGFVLLSERDKCQRIAAWAGVLASLAREDTPVHRVQWTSRTIPSALRAPGPEIGSPLFAEKSTNGSALCSYEALLDTTATSFYRHEVLLSIKVRGSKTTRATRGRGGSYTSGCALVLREAANLRRRLATAGIQAEVPLSAQLLESFIRASFDRCPNDAAARRADAETCSGVHAATGMSGSARAPWPWPMRAQEEWSRVLVDGTWHRTYWISEWPRLEVGPDFLGPLLLMPEVRHSVSVVMEPMSPASAARKLEQARTADVADAELRRRGGFLATARRRREEQLVAQREVELADGHAPFRFSGYVTVSAHDPDLLEESSDAVEQAAARSGIELRTCYGDQRRALCTAIPLCRGLA